jgi:hypothetical protein
MAKAQRYYSSSKEEEWRSWPCDDFPKERLSYLVLGELAGKLRNVALRERWKLAVKLISDPCEWDTVGEEKKAEIYATHRRAKPNPCLERLVEKLVEARILTKRARDRIKVFLGAFLIPKMAKKTVRIIVNAIPTNELLASIPKVVLPGLRSLDELILKNDFFVEYDGKSYYNQFELGDAVKAFFGLRVGKTNYVWSTGPMGWAPMVFIAQSATEVLCEDVEDKDVDKTAYIDNVYLWGKGPSTENIRASQRRFETRCESANALFSVTKELSPTGDVIGVHVDCKKKTEQLTSKFVEKLKGLKENMDAVFNDGLEGVTHRHIWKLFGSIVWATRILRVPFLEYPDFWFWIRRRAGYLTRFPDLWERPCKIPGNVVLDIGRLLDRLIENKAYQLKKEEEPVPAVDLYVDASGCGIGACIPTEDTMMSGHLPNGKKNKTIAYYELYALYKGLQWAHRKFPHTKNWRVYTDNTNVEAWVRKGMGPSYEHVTLLQKINALGPFTLHRVKSASNFADKPSRIAAATRRA